MRLLSIIKRYTVTLNFSIKLPVKNDYIFIIKNLHSDFGNFFELEVLTYNFFYVDL